jgi:ribosomal protein L7/L12
LDQGKKIEAIKVYREHTASSLKDAKDAVEALQRGASLPPSTEANADLEAEVLRIFEQGEKIRAVKLYKDRTGATLFDSKQAVERIAERHGIKVEGGGCGGVLVLSMVVMIAVAVVAAMMIARK